MKGQINTKEGVREFEFEGNAGEVGRLPEHAEKIKKAFEKLLE